MQFRHWRAKIFTFFTSISYPIPQPSSYCEAEMKGWEDKGIENICALWVILAHFKLIYFSYVMSHRCITCHRSCNEVWILFWTFSVCLCCWKNIWPSYLHESYSIWLVSFLTTWDTWQQIQNLNAQHPTDAHPVPNTIYHFICVYFIWLNLQMHFKDQNTSTIHQFLKWVFLMYLPFHSLNRSTVRTN